MNRRRERYGLESTGCMVAFIPGPVEQAVGPLVSYCARPLKLAHYNLPLTVVAHQTLAAIIWTSPPNARGLMRRLMSDRNAVLGA
jgi:hypothetical protein